MLGEGIFLSVVNYCHMATAPSSLKWQRMEVGGRGTKINSTPGVWSCHVPDAQANMSYPVLRLFNFRGYCVGRSQLTGTRGGDVTQKHLYSTEPCWTVPVTSHNAQRSHDASATVLGSQTLDTSDWSCHKAKLQTSSSRHRILCETIKLLLFVLLMWPVVLLLLLLTGFTPAREVENH